MSQVIKKISCTGTCICEYFILLCNACLIRMFSKLKIAFRVLCWWCSAQNNCFTNRLENRRPGICSWEFKLKTVLELLQRCATALSRKSFWIVRCRLYLRPKTAFPRIDPLEAKDRNARGQRHRRTCSPKKSLQSFFSGDLKKRSSKIFLKILTIQKNSAVLEQRTGQFSRTWPSRPRSSKCVLEDSTSVNYVKANDE